MSAAAAAAVAALLAAAAPAAGFCDFLPPKDRSPRIAKFITEERPPMFKASADRSDANCAVAMGKAPPLPEPIVTC